VSYCSNLQLSWCVKWREETVWTLRPRNLGLQWIEMRMLTQIPLRQRLYSVNVEFVEQVEVICLVVGSLECPSFGYKPSPPVHAPLSPNRWPVLFGLYRRHCAPGHTAASSSKIRLCSDEGLRPGRLRGCGVIRACVSSDTATTVHCVNYCLTLRLLMSYIYIWSS